MKLRIRISIALFGLVIFYFLAFVFLAQGHLFAQEKNPVEITGDRVEYLSVEKRMEATGNATVKYENIRMTCDKLSLDVATNMVFAEGNAKIYQENSIMSGDKLIYNLKTKEGKAYNVDVESDMLYGKGQTTEKLSEREMQIRRGYFTTCDLENPHYRIWAKKFLLYPGDRLVMKNAFFYIGETPILYLPKYVYLLNDDRPRVVVMPGKEKTWGLYTLSNWRYYFNEGAKGIVRFDYREKRDLATGFELYYKPKDFGEDWQDIDLGSGSLKTYYMNERKLGRDHLWDKWYKDTELTTEKERFRVQWRHEWEIDEFNEAIWEYNRVKDQEFMKDYFYRDEYEKDAKPDTYFLFTHTKPGYNLSLLDRKRVDRNLSVLERQPEITFNLTSQPIFGNENYYDDEGLLKERIIDPYFQNTTIFSSLNNKNAHSDIDSDVERFDTYNKLSFPEKFFYISLNPYLAIRETYFSKDINGDSIDPRAVFYYGVETSTKFFRIFDFNTNFLNLDINDVRHIVTPSINYDFVNDPTIPSSKLLQFDGIDSISRSEVVTLSLENKLQTKRENKTVDLVRFITDTSYNLNDPSGSRFGNINYDLEVTPYSNTRIELDATYDTQEYFFKDLNTDVTFYSAENKYFDTEIFGDNWSGGIGYRYQRKGSKQLTTEGALRLNPKWKFKVYERFELARGKYLREQEYTLFRDLHCWVVQVTYNVNREYGESIWIAFKLKAFPEMSIDFDNSYHQPKARSQSRTFEER